MKRLKTLKRRKGLKDKEKEDPTSDKGLENNGDSENESYSEVKRSINQTLSDTENQIPLLKTYS